MTPLKTPRQRSLARGFLKENAATLLFIREVFSFETAITQFLSTSKLSTEEPSVTYAEMLHSPLYLSPSLLHIWQSVMRARSLAAAAPAEFDRLIF